MKTPRIVLDANVIVSAILFGGPPADVIRRMVDGSAQGFTSMPILDEVREVLQRPKFALSPEQALTVIEELHSLCRMVGPTNKVRAVAAGPDDDIVLECAAAAAADAIITGDKHLLALRQWRGIHILSPAQFLREQMERP
jgi:putative PIN family toxin of toxin-antitoxin system